LSVISSLHKTITNQVSLDITLSTCYLRRKLFGGSKTM